MTPPAHEHRKDDASRKVDAKPSVQQDTTPPAHSQSLHHNQGVPSYSKANASNNLRIEQSPSWTWIQSSQNILLTSNQAIINSTPYPMTVLQSLSHDENEPNFRYQQNLLAALMLSTVLASFSAFDAKNQCRSQAGYDVHDQFLDNYDDGGIVDDVAAYQDERFACLQMFRAVVIPVGVAVLMLSILSVLILRSHQSRLETMHLLTTTTRLDHYQLNYKTCLRLILPVIGISLAWTYGTVAIMLRPRLHQSNEKDNPYLSLAAVDQMGHIGENANLYYLCWISVCLCVAVSYQLMADTVRQHRRCNREEVRGATLGTGDAVEAMLSLSKVQLASYHESRATWYQSLYRLRIRTGIWTAALLSSLVVMASSVHIWKEVLIPAAQELDITAFGEVCKTLSNSYNPELPPELCARTSISLFSGLVAAILSVMAIGLHLLTRTGAAHAEDNAANTSCEPALALQADSGKSFTGTHIPLRSEFMLAVLLVILLGLNAVYATGVQGPAASVGNLYYASWLSFLLCLRIALGCLEELCHIHEECGEGDKLDDESSTPRYLSPSADGSEDRFSSRSKSSFVAPEEQTTDLMENERAQRTRKYLFLAIGSLVCSASALDAAYNQSNPLSLEQHYVIFAPSVVASLSAGQFLLCLHRRSYLVVSQMWFGGVASIAIFGICLGELVITMHSDSSWAVNAIGDVQIANLYYFSWASILTAGFQMMSYLNHYLGLKQEDYMTIAWIAVVKVCFVIFGAGYHIWHNISDTCTLTDIQSGAVTFCSRTIFAIAVSCTGMLVAGLVAFCRILIAMSRQSYFSRRIRAHVEMVVAFFLMLLFGFAVATITGIGGPGQSVGDMFYATWLTFLVTIGLVIVCFQEIAMEEKEAKDVGSGVSSDHRREGIQPV